MKIERPIFIIGTFRGGTSILFRLLSESSELYSLYRESNHFWNPFHRHDSEEADTVQLQAKDVDVVMRTIFDEHYHYSSYDNYILGFLGRVKLLRGPLSWLFDFVNLGNYIYKAIKIGKAAYRVVDKTPPNCYRVSFLKKLYPDAKFIYLTRDGLVNTSSLMNAWNNPQRFKFRYRRHLCKAEDIKITGYDDDVWKFSIPADWKDWLDKSLAEVCAHQWADAHKNALESFNQMDEADYVHVKFEDLLADPQSVIANLCDFAEVEFSSKMRKIVEEMPLVNTASKPSEEKFKQNEAGLEKVKAILEPVQVQLGYS